MNTNKCKTSGYSPFELLYGWLLVQSIDLALSFDDFNEMKKVPEYAIFVREWLEVAREIAEEKANRTHETQAPRFFANTIVKLHQFLYQTIWCWSGDRYL